LEIAVHDLVKSVLDLARLRREDDVVDFFEQQVERTPEAIALTSGSVSLSYADLDKRSSNLACCLMEEGVSQEDVVAVLLPRSIESVIAILAILKSGAAYLPIDPANPKERIDLFLRDSRPALVVTSGTYRWLLPSDTPSLLVDSTDVQVLLDQYGEASFSRSFKRRRCVPLNAAYVLYTSGSTGIPKAVIGLHGGLANRLAWFNEHFSSAAPIAVLARSSPGFIDALTELLGPLIQGAHVVLAPPEAGGDPFAIAQLVGRYDLERITLTPSLLNSMLTTELAGWLKPCKLWISSGELLAEATIDQFNNMFPDAKLVNLYGCSEVSGDSLCNDSGLASRSIGLPIWGTRIRVLDEHLVPCPIGVAGDLYLCGIGLARGYQNRPSLTAERFVADPYDENGSRIYRTGDVATLRPDGNVDLVGRSDRQIKIRGIRLELGEVEGILRSCLPITDAVAVSCVDQHGDIKVNGYVSVSPGSLISGFELRRQLQGSIPVHMIPASIVVLEKIPYNINGKVDWKSLPEPIKETEVDSGDPISPEVQVLCRIIKEMLGLGKVNADANLFDLGVHSLIATRIASRIRTELKVDCTIAKLFEAKTISRLAEMLRSGEKVTRPKIRPR
jgi:amino acid adenylation domain-containing protein